MKISIEQINELSIEELVELIRHGLLAEEDFKKQVASFNLNASEKNSILAKYERAMNRIILPLKLSQKLFFLLMPFGIITLPSNSSFEELDNLKKLRFIKRYNQGLIYSTIGVLIYVIIGIVAGLYFK
jgi:hypothetical protein